MDRSRMTNLLSSRLRSLSLPDDRVAKGRLADISLARTSCQLYRGVGAQLN
jgi:hypothetical protein